MKFAKLYGDQLFFAKHYNYHPLDSREKTVIGSYDLSTERVIHSINPKFKHIEFSHFSPRKWVAFCYELQ